MAQQQLHCSTNSHLTAHYSSQLVQLFRAGVPAVPLAGPVAAEFASGDWFRAVACFRGMHSLVEGDLPTLSLAAHSEHFTYIRRNALIYKRITVKVFSSALRFLSQGYLLPHYTHQHLQNRHYPKQRRLVRSEMLHIWQQEM